MATTKKITKPVEMDVDCTACGGKRNALTYATELAECAKANGGAHLHRSCSTCGFTTCEPLMGKT